MLKKWTIKSTQRIICDITTTSSIKKRLTKNALWTEGFCAAIWNCANQSCFITQTLITVNGLSENNEDLPNLAGLSRNFGCDFSLPSWWQQPNDGFGSGTELVLVLPTKYYWDLHFDSGKLCQVSLSIVHFLRPKVLLPPKYFFFLLESWFFSIVLSSLTLDETLYTSESATLQGNEGNSEDSMENQESQEVVHGSTGYGIAYFAIFVLVVLVVIMVIMFK